MDSFGTQLLVEQKGLALGRLDELDESRRQKEWMLIFEFNAVIALQIKNENVAKLLNDKENFSTINAPNKMLVNTNLSSMRANIWDKTCFLTPKVCSVTLICNCINAPFFLVMNQHLGLPGQIVGAYLCLLGH